MLPFERLRGRNRRGRASVITRVISSRWAALVAVTVGCLLGWWCYVRLTANPGTRALDFTYAWRAAGHLLAGRDPYASMPRAPYTAGGLFLYPLTTALVATPFASLKVVVAGSVFFALSSAAMAYAVARRAPHLSLAFFSPAFVLAYYNIQWSPLVFASALLPALGWLCVAKPNLGLEAFAYAPRWSTVSGAVAIGVLALALEPRWPLDWLAQLRQQEAPHDPPLLWPLGLVGLAGLLRWRTREGRLLAVATIAPAMSLPYDHLLLWLIARTWREAALLTVTSWCGYLAVLATAPHDLTKAPQLTQLLLALGLYLPAAGIVLARRNPPLEPTSPRPADRRDVAIPRIQTDVPSPSKHQTLR